MFGNFKQAIKDLIFGRKIQIKEPKAKSSIKVYTVQVEQTKVPTPTVKINSTEITQQILSQSEQDPIEVPFEDSNKLAEFEQTFREPIYQYLIKRLTMAINTKQPSVAVFRFGKSNKTASIHDTEYEPQLNKILAWCVKQEDYESASQCRDLIRKLKENVID